MIANTKITLPFKDFKYGLGDSAKSKSHARRQIKLCFVKRFIATEIEHHAASRQ